MTPAEAINAANNIDTPAARELVAEYLRDAGEQWRVTGTGRWTCPRINIGAPRARLLTLDQAFEAQKSWKLIDEGICPNDPNTGECAMDSCPVCAVGLSQDRWTSDNDPED